MGYGKERPCKKCAETKPIMARGLCCKCFTEERNAGTLDNFPAARPANGPVKQNPHRTIDLLLQELRNIANANPQIWDDPSDFQGWAQSRARHAISIAERESVVKAIHNPQAADGEDSFYSAAARGQ